MSISDQIIRLNNAKANIKQSIENKGVTVDDSALLDEYPALIDSIEVGGGNSYYEELLKAITNNNTDYSNLFSGYKGTIPDVSNWDTSNVTTMERMFNLCSNITSLDLSSWDVSKVTSMYYMFYYCKQLTSLGDISNWDIGNVTTMSYMFSNCGKLTSLDLSGWNTSNVTGMGSIFQYCESLTSLDLSNWDMTKVTASYAMTSIFQGCKSLYTLRLDNCSYDTINKLITSSNFPTKAIDGVTRTIYCKEENIGDLVAPTNWVFSFVTEEEEPEIPDVPEDIPVYVPGEFESNSEITEVSTMVTSEHTELNAMFSGCTSLTTVNGTDKWDTSNVYNMNCMFQSCQSLTSLDVSTWNTSNVITMDNTFCSCYSLASLDVSNWDTSNVTVMYGLFYFCCALESLDLSSWSTSLVENMGDMFYGCESLQTLDLRNWDASNSYNMNYMLYNCTSLHTLRLDNCSYDTISKIVNSDGFPADNYGTIYCKEENAADFILPGNWTFSFVE